MSLSSQEVLACCFFICTCVWVCLLVTGNVFLRTHTHIHTYKQNLYSIHVSLMLLLYNSQKNKIIWREREINVDSIIGIILINTIIVITIIIIIIIINHWMSIILITINHIMLINESETKWLFMVRGHLIG